MDPYQNAVCPPYTGGGCWRAGNSDNLADINKWTLSAEVLMMSAPLLPGLGVDSKVIAGSRSVAPNPRSCSAPPKLLDHTFLQNLLGRQQTPLVLAPSLPHPSAAGRIQRDGPHCGPEPVTVVFEGEASSIKDSFFCTSWKYPHEEEDRTLGLP